MYLHWDERTITDFSNENIEVLYAEGFVFTRIGKGVMHQTRSVRVDLSKFELSSENRRILKKTDGLGLNAVPLPYSLYHWSIGKMAKDFYETKFGLALSLSKGDKIFSANKVKELLTHEEKSNFNALLVYSLSLRGEGAPTTKQSTEMDSPAQIAEPVLSRVEGSSAKAPRNDSNIGYAICYETNELLHYSYPFYQLSMNNEQLPKDLGLGMMIRAIVHAKERGKKYIYLGSAQRPSDTYKMQFAGVEWFDGKEWKNGVEELKKILAV